MSSPNSSSHNGAAKRKRNASNASASTSMPQIGTTTAAAPPLQQAESRDASGEDGDTTAPESAGRPRRPEPGGVTGHPPSKRQRSAAADAASSSSSSKTPAAAAADPGEPSDTTEASVDIAQRVTRKGRGKGDKEADDGENGSADSAMPPPPIGKLTHPVGYTTNPPPVGRSVRVYADGVFDLFHLGHMRQLEQAKKAFPDVYLLVGVTGDEETHKRKGLTVLSGRERAETLRHCKWVDEVIENCPWIVTPEFLDQHEIDYVAHDDLPYGAAEGDDIYSPVKAAGKFLVTQRTEGVSTTGIITKIVRDYEKYIARQFKRGTSRQELNVSWLKKNELDLKRHVQDLRDNIRSNWTTTGQDLSRELRGFWPSSRPQSPSPQSRAMPPPSGPVPNGDHQQQQQQQQQQILQQLQLPPSSPAPPAAVAALARTPTTPGGSSLGSAGGGNMNEFVKGYTLGLIGGVRSWMTKSRSTNQDNSRPASDDDSEESEDKAASPRPQPAAANSRL